MIFRTCQDFFFYPGQFPGLFRTYGLCTHPVLGTTFSKCTPVDPGFFLRAGARIYISEIKVSGKMTQSSGHSMYCGLELNTSPGGPTDYRQTSQFPSLLTVRGKIDGH